MRIKKYYSSDNYTPDFKEISTLKTPGARDRLSYSQKAVLEDNPKIVLDIGCGSGEISKLFTKDGAYVIGLEINLNMAKRAGQYIDVVIADAEEPWSIKNESIDVVYMGAFLEHAFDYDHIFLETKRVLKKGGKLVILIPNAVNLKDRLVMLFGKQPGWYKIKGHIRFWTLPWLRKILSEHGFKEIYAIGFPFPFKTLLYKCKLKHTNIMNMNIMFKYMESKLPGLCKLLLWKGIKI